MAILTTNQLADQRRECAQAVTVINYTKPQFNAAAQAVEDVFTSASLRTALNNAINNATTPLVLDAAQKRALILSVLKRLIERF